MKTIKNNISVILSSAKNLWHSAAPSDGSRSFPSFRMTMMAGIVLALTACTNEDTPQPEVSGDYLTATATAPAEAFGSLSRALPTGYSDLTLHYTSAQTDAFTAYAVAASSISTSTDNNVTTLTFTTKSDGTEGSTSLVWPQIKEGTPLYLTVSTTGEEMQLWGTCTPDTHGAAFTFGEPLKPRYTKLSVAVTVKNTAALTDASLTVKAAIKAEADEADASTQAWPTKGDAVDTPIGEATAVTLTENTDSKQGTATVSGIFAPQTLDGPLSFAYAGGSWTLDLSKIAVTGGTEGQMANQLVAGQHLTVSVTLNMTTLGTPTVTLTGISAAATDSYTGGLSGAATYTVTYGETTAYMTLDELLAFIQGEANTDISITGSVSTFAEEAIMDVADNVTLTINGKQTRFFMGTNKTADDLKAKITAAVAAGVKAITVTGNLTAEQQAAVKSGIENGTDIHLSLPQTAVIGYQAFWDCSALTEITLADGAVIGNYAFYNCTNLATVNGTLSSTIGSFAFCQCSALTAISLANGTEIGDYAFYSCTSLATVNGTLSGTIGESAFFRCSKLTAITLEDGTGIGTSAFYQCSKLETVNGTLSGTIGNYAFENCSALTAITLANVTVIGNFAFRYCNSMTSLTLQGVVTSVGNGAFESVGYKNENRNCALTLASGQTVGDPDVENKTWAGNSWKSITIK